VATKWIAISDEQMGKTKEKDFGVCNEEKKDEEATENVEE